jgi:hypothetical protein
MNTHDDENAVITLNVGGKRYQTTKATLCTAIPNVNNGTGEHHQHEHFFTALFNSNFSLQTVSSKYGTEVFIDRDGTHFRYILNYLRSMASGSDTIQYSLPFHQKQVIDELKIEATFYMLEHLLRVLESEDYLVGQTVLRGIFQDTIIIRSRIHEQCLHQYLMDTLHEMKLTNVKIHDNRSWRLVFRASQSGFSARAFHDGNFVTES